MYAAMEMPVEANKAELWHQSSPRIEMQGHAIRSEIGGYGNSRPAELGSGRPQSEIGKL